MATTFVPRMINLEDVDYEIVLKAIERYGLGLILPGITRSQTRLVPLAAAGLALVMVLAAIYHIPRGEYGNIGPNLINAAVLAFVAYGRWKLVPIPERS